MISAMKNVELCALWIKKKKLGKEMIKKKTEKKENTGMGKRIKEKTKI